MDIRDKAKILGQFVTKYKDSPNEAMQDFIKVHNLGLPLGFALDADWIEIKHDIIEYFIESTYDDLVKFLMCDPAIEYSSVEEMLPL